MLSCAVALRLDRRFAAWAVAWTGISLFVFGLVSAIIPNPVFGRQIPPEPFAYWVWLLSAPLMGLVGATWSAPVRQPAPATPPATFTLTAVPPEGRNGSTVGALAGFGAFLAIGCPVCNKLALVLLGTSGALSIWAPLQPVIGAASLLLLAGTLAWRFRLRRTGGACAI